MTEKDDFHKYGLALSDVELILLEQIIAQWSALEHEIFSQTLLTFDNSEDEEKPLPNEMHNIQFTGILRQWKERVVDKSKGETATVLQEQFDRITHLKEYRDALVHGMWEWSPADLDKISTVRVRKKQIITTHFTADDLHSFSSSVSGINFKIRYPRGLEDLANERAKQGGSMSRRAMSMLSGNPLADDWLSGVISQKKEDE